MSQVETPKTGTSQWALRIQGFLAVVGVLIADHLLQVHVLTNFGSAADTGLCAAVEGFSCADAAQSEYAKIGSLPIAALGEAYYLAILGLTAIQRFKPAMSRLGPNIVFFSALLGVGYSGYLAYVSVTQVGAWCPWCVALYVANLGLLIVGWRTLPEGLGGALRHIPTLLKTKLTFFVVAMLVAATFATQGIYVYKANQEVERHNAIYAKLNPNAPKHFDVNVEGTPARGPDDALVTIVEYSDFQCPYCRRLSRILQEVAKREPKLLKYRFKHFPMSFHKHAKPAAIASVCAQRQGKFWEMHDLLYDNQHDLDPEDLAGYALKIGLDMDRYRGCIKDPAALAKVEQDRKEGKADSVRGTPTMFINGWRTVGARPADALQAMVRQAAQNVKKAQGEPEKKPEKEAEKKTEAQPSTPPTPTGDVPAGDATEVGTPTSATPSTP